MLNKEFLSYTASALTIATLIPYLISILSNKLKPHVFSWIIWGITTILVFLGQLSDSAGIGAWPIGVSGVITIIIAILAFIKRADTSITRTDKILFIAALSSLPAWILTKNPLASVTILTLVDVLGFGPTIRKSYQDPHSESVIFFLIFVIRNLLVVCALENYTITTVIFPAAIGTACLLLVIMILIRRKYIVST